MSPPSSDSAARGAPAPAELLRAVARHETLDKAAESLGISVARLRVGLATLADTLESGQPRTKTPPAPEPELPWHRRAAPAGPTPVSSPLPAAAGQVARMRLECDGAARGNPGPAGAGAVLRRPDGTVVERLGRWLGVQTNNVAEYEGLLLGMRRALELGARELEVRADSLLVVSQMRGEWKVKHPGLRPLFDAARALVRRFDRVDFAHVPRERNADADEMSNRAIDERM